jgi:uncharacterized protein
MDTILSLAATNLLSPMVLFFALGVAATLARSDLAIPEAIAKGMALYLMLAIGFKGGVGVASTGPSWTLAAALVAGVILSAGMPTIAFALRPISRASMLPPSPRTMAPSRSLPSSPARRPSKR